MPSSKRNLIFFFSVEVLIMGGYRFREWFRRQYEGKLSPNAARVRLALPKSRFASSGLPLGPLYFIGWISVTMMAPPAFSALKRTLSPTSALSGSARATWCPLSRGCYSERDELVRVMAFPDLRTVAGRTLPTRWEMRPIAKPGYFTTVVLKEARFNQPVDEAVFTQRNLQKP